MNNGCDHEYHSIPFKHLYKIYLSNMVHCWSRGESHNHMYFLKNNLFTDSSSPLDFALGKGV